MAFDFNTKLGGALGRSGGHYPRVLHNLDGVHGLRFHPPHAPSTGMDGFFRARMIRHAAIRTMITNMR